MRVLVTGGTGFIGSHVAIALVEAGHEPVLLDDFSNSSPDVLKGITEIIGWNPTFYEGDVRNENFLFYVFRNEPIHAVIHLAGFKSVAESFQKPLAYYGNNLGSTFALLRAMGHRQVRNLVFSSSATVYGNTASVPYQEHYDLAERASSPYAKTKIMNERILRDLAKADHGWRFSVLRYFNPAGAHPSGLIGENPIGEPNNLFPYITQVLTGERELLTVHGRDYPTNDGTCERDYLHVMDLARGHVRALEASKWCDRGEVQTWNLGRGKPYSVVEVILAFERAAGREVNWVYGPRRAGDLPAFWADPNKAYRDLGWQATHTLDQIAEDAWRYASRGRPGSD